MPVLIKNGEQNKYFTSYSTSAVYVHMHGVIAFKVYLQNTLHAAYFVLSIYTLVFIRYELYSIHCILTHVPQS